MTATASAKRHAMSIADTAAYLGTSVDTIRRAIKTTDGTGLRAKMVGAKYSITVADAETWHANLPDA